MTITLPPATAADIRAYAAREHAGKVSPAVAEILEYWFIGERIGIDLRTSEGVDLRTGSVTKSPGELPGEATRSSLT